MFDRTNDPPVLWKYDQQMVTTFASSPLIYEAIKHVRKQEAAFAVWSGRCSVKSSSFSEQTAMIKCMYMENVDLVDTSLSSWFMNHDKNTARALCLHSSSVKEKGFCCIL